MLRRDTGTNIFIYKHIDLFSRLRLFHYWYTRTTCCITIVYSIVHPTSSAILLDIKTYYNRWLLLWTSRVTRMLSTRAPRKLLVSWVNNPQLLVSPQINFSRALERSHVGDDPPSEYAEWREIAGYFIQRRAVCGSQVTRQKRNWALLNTTYGLSSGTVLCPHEYRTLTQKKFIAIWNERKSDIYIHKYLKRHCIHDRFLSLKRNFGG
jgi:hypothetical protein